jgi:hypothetical protein
MKENEVIKQCSEVVEEYICYASKDAISRVEEVISGKLKGFDRDELIEIIRDANSWIRYLTGDETDLYDDYCYRIFEKEDGNVYIATGKEVKEIHDL